jgi:hypothetical protein
MGVGQKAGPTPPRRDTAGSLRQARRIGYDCTSVPLRAEGTATNMKLSSAGRKPSPFTLCRADS